MSDGQTPLFSLPDAFVCVARLAIAAPAARQHAVPIVAAAMGAGGVQPE